MPGPESEGSRAGGGGGGGGGGGISRTSSVSGGVGEKRPGVYVSVTVPRGVVPVLRARAAGVVDMLSGRASERGGGVGGGGAARVSAAPAVSAAGGGRSGRVCT